MQYKKLRVFCTRGFLHEWFLHFAGKGYIIEKEVMDMRIAVCDDEKIFLTDVKERLSAMGLSCDCYDHEARLLDAFLQDSACYHLVILDMQLSEQEGIAVAKKYVP